MSKTVLTVVYVLVMIALIVGVDVAFLRNDFWLRLVVNVAIVAAFLAGYWMFLRHR